MLKKTEFQNRIPHPNKKKFQFSKIRSVFLAFWKITIEVKKNEKDL